jgi:hypothetical protein
VRKLTGKLSQRLVTESCPSIESVNALIACIGFDDYALNAWVLEEKIHNGPKHPAREAGFADGARRNQYMHTDVPRKDIEMGCDFILSRVIPFQKERWDAADLSHENVRMAKYIDVG